MVWRSPSPARSRACSTTRQTLNLSAGAVGAIATVYLFGEVVGALWFGRLADRLGRRNLFMVTVGVYLAGSGLTALTLGAGTGWLLFLYATRFIAGMGIGGEYAAINSAIDEFIPARYPRAAWTIAVTGSYWFRRDPGHPGRTGAAARACRRASAGGSVSYSARSWPW